MLCSLVAERDAVERDNRDKETKVLNLTRMLDDLNERLAESERLRVQQNRELEDFISSKDDVGKSVRIVNICISYLYGLQIYHT